MNGTQGSPDMFLHRAWVFLLYQSPNFPTPSPSSACIMWPGLQITQGPGPEHSMAQMQHPTGKGSAFLYLRQAALLNAFHLLTIVPL